MQVKFISLLSSLFIMIQLNAQELNIYTEVLHPLSYVERTQNKGIVIDLTKALFKEAEIDYKFHSFPWARSYHKVQHESNSFVVPLIRNKKREKLFHWIGPLVSFKSYFYKLKARKDIQVKNWEDLKNYRIGVVNQYNSHQLLLKYDKHNEIFISTANDKKANVRKLIHGRVDLIPSLPFTMHQVMNAEGFDISMLEITIPMKQNDYYLGINRDTNPAIVKKLEDAFKRLQKSGQIFKILQDYPEVINVVAKPKAI